MNVVLALFAFSTLAYLAYTPTKPDFTALSSLGSVEEVAKTIVPEADGVVGELLSGEQKSGSYGKFSPPKNFSHRDA